MPALGCHSSFNLFHHADMADQISDKILEAIRTNGSLNETTLKVYPEQQGWVIYRETWYVYEGDQSW
jgi:hypothetical protein